MNIHNISRDIKRIRSVTKALVTYAWCIMKMLRSQVKISNSCCDTFFPGLFDVPHTSPLLRTDGRVLRCQISLCHWAAAPASPLTTRLIIHRFASSDACPQNANSTVENRDEILGWISRFLRVGNRLVKSKRVRRRRISEILAQDK